MMHLPRVGADTGEAGSGFRSPIFENHSYLFVPIPENTVIPEIALTYGTFTWRDQPVLRYVPQGMAHRTIHNDPEFSTFTYGVPIGAGNNGNYVRLRDIQAGDIIVFYAAFIDGFRNAGLYFFAYIVVQRSIEYRDPAELDEEARAMVTNNHHFIHGYADQVIVVGNHELSRVFNRAVLLSGQEDRVGGNYYPSHEIAQRTGYQRSMNRSSLRRIEPAGRAEALKAYLDAESA